MNAVSVTFGRGCYCLADYRVQRYKKLFTHQAFCVKKAKKQTSEGPYGLSEVYVCLV